MVQEWKPKEKSYGEEIKDRTRLVKGVLQISEEDEGKAEFSPFIEYIRRRIFEENKNFLIALVGQTGSGKSFSAMKLGEAIDPNFSINNVVFTAKDFFELLKQDHPRGTVIIFDEAGVGIPAREWYSISNKLMGYILQTFRHRNWIVIFTVPDFDFIDKQARKLFHCYMETTHIDYTERICELKPMLIVNNPRAKTSRLPDYWFQYLKIFEDGELKPIRRLYLGLPSRKTRDDYEIKKLQFTKGLASTLSDEMDVHEKIRKLDIKRRLNDTTEEKTKDMEQVRMLLEEGISQVKVSKITGLSLTKISRIKKDLEYLER